VNEENPVMRFTPGRNFTFSRGWGFQLVNRGRTNNYGFINDQDYDSAAHSPLLAVIGDSYVEALMVPYAETLHGRLANCMRNRGRVYSFGISGAPLSQYLAEAGFARSRFHPDGFVVVVVGNDFDESFQKYNTLPGIHYFREDSSKLTIQRVDYSPGLVRRVMRQSALVRYLRQNLPSPGTVMEDLKSILGSSDAAASRHVGNTAAGVTLPRLNDSRRAVDAFLSNLAAYAGVDQHHILLLVDGMRPDLYSERGLQAAAGSFFDVMRRHLIQLAIQRGYEVVDMQPRFIQRHARDGARFEFPTDGHWNGSGHQEAARAVATSQVFRQIFQGPSCVL
jgi:hypothetical protein